MDNRGRLKVKLIFEKYFGSISLNDFNVKRIPYGICNESYKVSYKKDFFILQKLNSALAKYNSIKDFDFISKKLSSLGWNVPILLENNKGNIFTKEDKSIWRIYSFISGTMINELASIDYISIGKLLARFHADLKKINYFPIFSIPHFHDTKYFINKLRKVADDFGNGELRSMSKNVVRLYEETKNVSLKNIQLIHGDPRSENFLFDISGKAISIIDFDTFMSGSIFIDIGDLLRSINLTKDQTELKFSENNTRDILRGYLSVYDGKDKNIFVSDALSGMKQMALELCSRFLIDIMEDKYFSWDKKKYRSRKENNIVRALAQWNLFEEAAKLT